MRKTKRTLRRLQSSEWDVAFVALVFIDASDSPDKAIHMTLSCMWDSSVFFAFAHFIMSSWIFYFWINVVVGVWEPAHRQLQRPRSAAFRPYLYKHITRADLSVSCPYGFCAWQRRSMAFCHQPQLFLAHVLVLTIDFPFHAAFKGLIS